MKSFKSFGAIPELTNRNGAGFKVEKFNDIKALENSGVVNTNAILVGDEITFPKPEDLHIVRVNTNEGELNGPKMDSVAVLRNGKPWLMPVGTMRRQGRDLPVKSTHPARVNASFACPLIKNLADDFTNDTDRMSSLLGKTIVCTAIESGKRQVFGKRDEWEEGRFPVLEFAEPKLNAEYFA